MERLDAIVVGTGPAGLEAAINLSIRKKSFLIFGNIALSNKLVLAPRIDNYLGLHGISGKDLADRFSAHLATMNIKISSEQVSSIYPMGKYFAVATNKDTYEATAVVLAAGVSSSKLILGEEKFLGRGVGYCATCDAPLYKGKSVAIIGYTEEAVHEANFVAELAATVYFIPAKKLSTPLSPRIKTISDSVLEITGDTKVTALILDRQQLAVDGVFVLRESIAPTSLLVGIDVQDGFITVDSQMRTNIPGCYAAGDCTGKPHQYMRAAGQGQTAGLGAVAYIDQLKVQE